MNFLSRWYLDVVDFFAGRDSVTPAQVLDDARVAVADLSAIVALAAIAIPTAPYVVPAAAALAVATRIVGALETSPKITDLAGVIRAIENVVAVFPAGPNHTKATAAIATVQAGYTTLTGGKVP